jgi:hypothetical protein
MAGFLEIIKNVGAKKFLGLGIVLYMLSEVQDVSPDVRAYVIGAVGVGFSLGQGFADGFSRKYNGDANQQA